MSNIFLDPGRAMAYIEKAIDDKISELDPSTDPAEIARIAKEVINTEVPTLISDQISDYNRTTAQKFIGVYESITALDNYVNNHQNQNADGSWGIFFSYTVNTAAHNTHCYKTNVFKLARDPLNSNRQIAVPIQVINNEFLGFFDNEQQLYTFISSFDNIFPSGSWGYIRCWNDVLADNKPDKLANNIFKLIPNSSYPTLPYKQSFTVVGGLNEVEQVLFINETAGSQARTTFVINSVKLSEIKTITIVYASTVSDETNGVLKNETFNVSIGNQTPTILVKKICETTIDSSAHTVDFKTRQITFASQQDDSINVSITIGTHATLAVNQSNQVTLTHNTDGSKVLLVQKIYCVLN